jgi:thiol-disulfide isomerase/thioredoxin
MTQSIAGQPAPELAVPYWIDAEGKERPPLTLKELGARHRLLFFYQHWCGGCYSHGFPTLQALVQDPRAEDVGVAAVQTAFEGAYASTRDKLLRDACALSPILGSIRPKADEEIRVVNAVAISVARSLAIAAIAPNGKMGRESVADANGT